jgi:hypothetical protein
VKRCTSAPASWFLEQFYIYIFFRVVVGHRSHRYASLLCLEIRKFILQDCFENQLVGTLVANCGEFANTFFMDYSISRESEAREEAFLNGSSKSSVTIAIL